MKKTIIQKYFIEGLSSERINFDPTLEKNNGLIFYETDTGKVYTTYNKNWVLLNPDVVSNFLELLDTPSSYTGQAGKMVVVDGSENGLSYSQPYTSADFNTDFSGKTTDDLNEGTNNLYFTESRVQNTPDVAANTSKRHDPVTLGTNTASALNLTGQELSLQDVFVQNTGDDVTGDLTISAGGVYGEDNLGQKVATLNYIQSRGMNLITNGFGFLGNNYNFSGFTFYTQDVPGGAGSFYTTDYTALKVTDELIPVNPKSYYKLDVSVKSIVYQPGNKQYIGVANYDVDKLQIGHYHVIHRAGSETVLSTDLNNGDNVINVDDASAWDNTTFRHFGWFPYTNSYGFTYPDYTYTRNVLLNAWSVGGISGNTITLTQPWSKGFLPAGTKVANMVSGGSYKYLYIGEFPSDWTRIVTLIGGENTNFNNDGSATIFRPYTAFVKLIFLINYPSTPAGSEVAIGAVSFSEVSGHNLEVSSIVVGQYPYGGLSPKAGEIRFNSATGKHEGYDGTTWHAFY